MSLPHDGWYIARPPLKSFAFQISKLICPFELKNTGQSLAHTQLPRILIWFFPLKKLHVTIITPRIVHRIFGSCMVFWQQNWCCKGTKCISKENSFRSKIRFLPQLYRLTPNKRLSYSRLLLSHCWHLMLIDVTTPQNKRCLQEPNAPVGTPNQTSRSINRGRHPLI